MFNKHYRTFLVALTVIFISSCSTTRDTQFPTNALNPQGPAAANIAELWWLMFALGIAVFLLVSLLMFYAIFKRNRADLDPETSDTPQQEAGTRWIIYGGLVMPTIVLAIVFAFTLRSINALAQTENPDLTIQVVGHMWWWEVRYPDQNVITANEIHIPVGYKVEFQLTSNDVIHSFWVPELQGKMDMIPGTTNTLQLQADAVGIYRGICGEFCGLQHAKMHYLIVAQTPEEFNEWLINQQQPAQEVTDENALRGQEVFFEVGCATCHAISGTQAVSAFGPDLTHLATRETIGAGILPNNRGNLAGWIVNAQSIKPGSRMPPMEIPGDDLQALLAYLETLD